VTDNEDIPLSLQFHNDWFQTNHDISIRFTSTIPVVEFIVVSTFVVFWVFLLIISWVLFTPGLISLPQFPRMSYRRRHLRLIRLEISKSSWGSSSMIQSASFAEVWKSRPTSSVNALRTQSQQLTSRLASSPTFSLISAGNAWAYFHPCGDRSESPPI
jgi:hypothetical protein